jgi:hypothetical protein
MKFKTQIETNELFSFLMKHSYAGFSGKIGILISLASAVLCIINIPNFEGNETKVIILAILALLFTVINPLLLYMKAKQQKLTNPAYKNEMEYELNEEGIALHVGEQEGGIPWDMIIKVVETGSIYILYTTRINAFLWPKKDMGEQEAEMIEYLLAHIDRKKVQLPKRMRG